jgi:transcriptional regulator with XRE-family HTH domain
MPGTAPPRGVGVELRWMRQAAKLSGPAIGEQLGLKQASVSRIERGERGISAAKILRWHEVCLSAARARLADEDVSVRTHRYLNEAVRRMEEVGYPDLLLQLAETAAIDVLSNEIVYRNGMDRRQLDLADLDDQALRLRQVQPLMVPGVLQTFEWARLTMLTAGISARDARAAAKGRVERSTRTLNNTGRSYHAVVFQNALEAVLAGSTVQTQADQLNNVLSAGRYDHITIQVLPRSTPLPRIPLGGFTIYDPRDTNATPTVLIDTDPATVKFASPDAIAEYEKAWQQYVQVALDPEESAEWIADAVHHITAT